MDKLLSYKEAASKYGINYHTLCGWVFQKKLPKYYVGDQVPANARIKESELVALLEVKTDPNRTKHPVVPNAVPVEGPADLMLVKDFAKKHGVSQGTISSWFTNKKVKKYSAGHGTTSLSESEALEWMATRRRGGAPQGKGSAPVAGKPQPRRHQAVSTVRTRLNKAIRDNGWSYVRVANGAGVAANTVSRLSKGHNLRPQYVQKIQDFLDRQEGIPVESKPFVPARKQPVAATNGKVSDPVAAVQHLIDENEQLKDKVSKLEKALQAVLS